jgi:hypothetical protein
LLALLGLRLLELGKLDLRCLILVRLLLRRLLVLEECGKAAKSCHDAP